MAPEHFAQSEHFAQWAERLVHDLNALSEPRSRELRLVEWLRAIEPGYAVRVIDEIVARAHGKHAAAQAVLLSLVNLRRYEAELGYQRLAELYRQADELDLQDVKHLLLDGRSQRRTEASAADGNEHLEKTLGERKALATHSSRDVLDRLLFDRHPHVIRILLSNPRIVEADVVRLAARRPLSPSVVKEIVRHPKWMTRYRVKLALVSNPYTPSNVAASLVAYLMKPDLRSVASNSTLADEVRAQAARLLLPSSGRVRTS